MSIESLTEADDGPRSKRPAILAIAVNRFGQVGYEATKWSDVAEGVGIGQTALYHYFESKAHCLLTIMRLSLSQSEGRFHEVTSTSVRHTEKLCEAVRAAYQISDSEALQSRILQANIALLGIPSSAQREENERLACRELVQRIEQNWTELLRSGMEAGEFPHRDPHTMARAVLGLIVSVWRWYRPDGPIGLPEIADFIEGCCVRMVTVE